MVPRRPTQPIGKAGEDFAAAYLEDHGLSIVGRHYLTRWGEIDLIARDQVRWVFVEVKIRTRATSLPAAESITRSKQKKIVQAALGYMKQHRLEDEEMRFDAVLIEGGQITWLQSAFEPSDLYTF